MVPALAVGFEDLKKRMESQNDMTEMQRIKLDEIEAKMNDIMQFHLLQTASKVREFKRRHIQLAQRVLTVRISFIQSVINWLADVAYQSIIPTLLI